VPFLIQQNNSSVEFASVIEEETLVMSSYEEAKTLGSFVISNSATA
jgi:hypothetical protein